MSKLVQTRSSKLVGGGGEENSVLQYQELDNNDDNGPPLDNYQFLAKEVNHDVKDIELYCKGVAS